MCRAPCRWHRERGCAQPGHLPHALLGPGSQPRTWLRRRLQTGDGSRAARRAGAEETRAVCSEGAHFGVRQSPVRPRERGELHCGKGSVRMAAGVAGPPAAGRAAVSAWSYGQRWRGVLALGTARRGPGLAGRGPKWPERAGLWKAFVPDLQWEAPPFFRNQHPQTSSALPQTCAMELWFRNWV